MKKEKKIIILLIIIIVLLTAGIGLLLLGTKPCNCENATSYPVSTLNEISNKTTSIVASPSLEVEPVSLVSYPAKDSKLVSTECDSSENMLQNESFALCYPNTAVATKSPESSSVNLINLDGGSENPEFIIESISSNLSKGFHNNGNNEGSNSIDSLINFFKGLYRNSEVTSEYIQGFYYRGLPAFKFDLNTDRVFTFTSELKLSTKEDKELIIIPDFNKNNMILIFRTVNAVTDSMIDSLELN